MSQSNTTQNDTIPKIPKKRENLFLAILFNIAIPVLILSKANEALGPTVSLLVAIAFPLSYALYDYAARKIINPLSVIGFFSMLFKGSFALFKLDGILFAAQEAALPIFIGVYALISLKFKRPLINYFIYNENIFKTDLLEQKLIENQNLDLFYLVTKKLTWLFGGTFLIAGILNYFLAYNIIISPAGTSAFNQELARMLFLSYMIILVPKLLLSGFGLWWLVRNLKKLTGLSTGELLKV